MAEVDVSKDVDMPFYQFLLQTNAITDKISTTHEINKLSEHDLIQLLINEKLFTKQQIENIYQNYLAIPLAKFGQTTFITEQSKQLPQDLSNKFNTVLLENNIENGSILAITNPLDLNIINTINRSLNTVCDVMCVSPDDLKMFQAKIYSFDFEIQNIIDKIAFDIEQSSTTLDSDLFSTQKESEIAELIKFLVMDAENNNCSDIHIENIDNKLTIRMRKDGILKKSLSPNTLLSDHLFRVLKIIANLDSTQDQHPLDGRFSITHNNDNINIRLSIMPLINGTSAVLRILGEEENFRDMQAIIHDPAVINTIKEYINQDSGLLIIVGPTGSGKTTTLYNTILNIDSASKKIITIEDPVEVILRDINQIQVRPEFDFDFPDALRSVLRQDPDVILIGEIRDALTAKIAMRAAITGHMVLASIHADNVETTIPRLLDLGIDHYYLESALKLIISQRLLRSVCHYCCITDSEYKESIKALQPYLSTKVNLKNLRDKFKSAKGCSICNYTGYLNRFPIFEYFNFSDIDFSSSDSNNITHIAHSLKLQLQDNNLLDNAFKAALAGKTTLAEVLKLVDKKQGDSVAL